MKQPAATATLAAFAVMFAICLLLPGKGRAQRGFEAGTYYASRYSVQDVPVGAPYVKYDYYGNPMGVYQVWQRASWHSESGGNYVLIWTGYNWQSQWRDGYIYWYDWVDYDRFLHY